jgi:hypothetical protein
VTDFLGKSSYLKTDTVVEGRRHGGNFLLFCRYAKEKKIVEKRMIYFTCIFLVAYLYK